jgi:A/G-specific adenine glycosylase
MGLQNSRLQPELFDEVNSKKASIRYALQNWGKTNFRCFPWREKPTPYSVLVTEVLLRRTTASAVSKIFHSFMLQFPSIEKLALADRAKLEELLIRVGYNKQRARILTEMAKFICYNYNCQIPNDKEKLLNIPHVGNYTANAIISLGYGVPSAMVDSNVSRIIRRLFLDQLTEEATLNIVQGVADILASEDENPRYNLTLLDFGALICTYGIPRCTLCPLNPLCDYYAKGKPRK